MENLPTQEWVRLHEGRDGDLIGKGRVGRITFIEGLPPEAELGDLVRVVDFAENPKQTVYFAHMEYDDETSAPIILRDQPPLSLDEMERLWGSKLLELRMGQEGREYDPPVGPLRDKQYKPEPPARVIKSLAHLPRAHRDAVLRKKTAERAELVRKIGARATAWVESCREFNPYYDVSEDEEVWGAGKAHEEQLEAGFEELSSKEREAVLREVPASQWRGGKLIPKEEAVA